MTARHIEPTTKQAHDGHYDDGLSLPKVVVVAYGCEPYATSEPGVGWNFVREISAFARPWVITRANNRTIIETAIASEPRHMRDRVQWIYVDLPTWAMRLKKHLPFGVQLYYSLWQWKAFFACRRVNKEVRFDIAHHLTYGINWLAPALALQNTPLIWGPIGGGDLVPSSIIAREPLRSRLQEFAYWIISRWIPHVSLLAWISRRRAAAILFRARSVEQTFPRSPTARRHVICETAMPTAPVDIDSQRTERIRAICIGRMEYWKGFRYAVEGFHEFLNAGGNGLLTLLGDGPAYEMLCQYCQDNRLEPFIDMPGKVPAKQVQRKLDESNVMIHPSFRDGGSWAVLEAMTKGVPVICMNLSGISDIVDSQSGILINASTPRSVTSSIADALIKLGANPELLQILGRGARKRVDQHYRWPQRRAALQEIYQNVLSTR